MNQNSDIMAGFTILELMLTIAIIGLLSQMAIGRFNCFQSRAASLELMMCAKAAVTGLRIDLDSGFITPERNLFDYSFSQYCDFDLFEQKGHGECLGDFNNDGIYSADDAQTIMAAMQSERNNPEPERFLAYLQPYQNWYDVNLDGRVTSGDMNFLANRMGQELPGRCTCN